MNQASNQPRTAPHLAGTVLIAVGLIVAFYLMGFHFVVAAGAGR